MEWQKAIEADWSDLKHSIKQMTSTHKSQERKEQLVKNFQRIQMNGHMTPYIRMIQRRIDEQPHTYVQPVPHWKHNDHEHYKPYPKFSLHIYQLLLLLTPRHYRPIILSPYNIEQSWIQFITSIGNTDRYYHKCRQKICPCCLGWVTWKFVRILISHTVQLIDTMKQKLQYMTPHICPKQFRKYQEFIEKCESSIKHVVLYDMYIDPQETNKFNITNQFKWCDNLLSIYSSIHNEFKFFSIKCQRLKSY